MYTRQTILIGILVLLVGVSGGLYGGLKLGVNKSRSSAFLQDRDQDRNGYGRDGVMDVEDHHQGFEGGSVKRGKMRTIGQNQGMVFGNIVSKDDKSVTVKVMDGSSRTIFYSDATIVSKSTPGNATDLAVGQQVRVDSTGNANGQVVAQTIQINQ